MIGIQIVINRCDLHIQAAFRSLVHAGAQVQAGIVIDSEAARNPVAIVVHRIAGHHSIITDDERELLCKAL
jgi:hypothetical protein